MARAFALSSLDAFFPPPAPTTLSFFMAALKRNRRGVLDKRAMSTESRRTQMSKLWILGHCLPLVPLLSFSLASAPCSGAGRSRVAPNQRSLVSPKTITQSSTNQRKWGDKSTPGVCVCVVFHPMWHWQGHSEGFKERTGGYNSPVTILSYGRRDFDGTHFIMARESEFAPLTLD